MCMKVWGVTDAGLVRKQNQDAYGVDINSQTGRVICVVCDGMGGPAGGDIASHIAVDAFLRSLKEDLRPGMTPEQIRQASSFAAGVANTAIRQEVEVRSEYRGMGTTLVAAVSYEEGVVVYHLHVAPEDMGRIIGKQGRIAKAIRVVMRAGASRTDQRIAVEID